METDLLDLYDRASAWTVEAVLRATDKLDAATPCDEWDVRNLLNHMLDTQRYFLSSGRGEKASPPSPKPPELLSADPVGDFRQTRTDMLAVYADSEVREKTGPLLGIAFSDLLLHTWDLARATGQDTTMPPGLAEADYAFIHGRFSDEQRKGMFKAPVPTSADASAQDRLLGYSGRDPS